MLHRLKLGSSRDLTLFGADIAWNFPDTEPYDGHILLPLALVQIDVLGGKIAYIARG